jgi:RsiW-degrading membrane proteinase PrsW (M82 family)
MSVQRRALLIASFGPALQTIGLAWEVLHLLVAHWNTPLTSRHLLYDPAVLLIVVGFFAALICVPVALEVARASDGDVEIPLYEVLPSAEPQRSSPRFTRGRASR